MRTRAQWVSNRIAKNVAAQGTPVTVVWTVTTGGTPDPATGGILNGVQMRLSGVLNAFGMIEPPQSVVRTFQEIQTGDLILDMGPYPQVNLFTGQLQSGVVALDSLDTLGAQFVWGGQVFAQQKIGAELAAAWDAVLFNVPMARTILLRRAT
jgi:hypothetical protein